MEVINIIVIILGYILFCLPYWRCFQQHHIEKYKAFIPFYNTFIFYGLFWSKKSFWIQFVAFIGYVVSMVCAFNATVYTMFVGKVDFLFILSWSMVFLTLIITIVYWVLINKKVALAYKKGFWWAMGLILFGSIARLLLFFTNQPKIELQDGVEIIEPEK